MSFCFDAFTAKATTVRFRLNLSRTVRYDKVELESDNAEVVSVLQEGRLSSVTRPIFDDCYYMIQDFKHVLFTRCNTGSNQVAHEIAKLDGFSTPGTWMESPLVEVVSFIIFDTLVLTNN